MTLSSTQRSTGAMSTVQEFWESASHIERPLNPSLRLGASFNPRKVKAGQWFTRLWWEGEPIEQPIRLRLVSIEVCPTGRIFNFKRDWQRMSVCAHILTKDFSRIVTAKDAQPFTGEELPETTGPDNEIAKTKYWYD